jgi:hypothetical protein
MAEAEAAVEALIPSFDTILLVVMLWMVLLSILIRLTVWWVAR